MAKHGPGTRATAALVAADIGFTSHTYTHDPRTDSYGVEAAEALDLDPTTVFKTLVVEVDKQPCVAIVPVTTLVDLKAIARAAGGRTADLADPVAAQRLTGYVVGGISPIGHRKKLPTYIDTSAQSLEVMYVSGGRRGFDIGLAPADLQRITEANWAPIART